MMSGLDNDNRYQTWRNINQRCYYKKDKKYHVYGGRGIKVCERWKRRPGDWKKPFKNFCEDMGARKPQMTIDRIDCDGNYEPSNCRWISFDENRKNRRKKTKLLGRVQRMWVLQALGFYKCGKCGITKTFHSFHLDSSSRRGYVKNCKECVRALTKIRTERKLTRVA
jgi:hypothetical protein